MKKIIRKDFYLKASLMIAVLVSTISYSQNSAYKTYTNLRYSYSIDYPATMLYPQNEQDELTTGQIFVSKNKANNLVVDIDWRYIDYDNSISALENLYNIDIKNSNGKNVTYKVKKQYFYVVSGYDANGNIFYKKTKMLDDLMLITAVLTYTKAERSFFDKATEIIFKSF